MSLDMFIAELNRRIADGGIEAARREIDGLEGTDPLRFDMGHAVLASAVNDMPAAMAHVRRAYERAPQEPAVLQYLAVGHRLQGDLANGERFAREAAARDGSARSYGTLGRILYDAGNLVEAEEAFAAAAAKAPEDAALLNSLGATRKGRGDYAAALNYFARSFESAPEDALSLQNVADMYAEAGWALGAMALARVTFEGHHPDEVKVVLGLVLLSLGTTIGEQFPEQHLVPEADQIVDALLQASLSRSPAVQITVGRALVDVGRLEAAESVLARFAGATLSSGDRASCAYLQGLVAERRGRAADALKHYTDSVRRDPRRWDACTNAVSLLLERTDPEALEAMGTLVGAVPPAIKASRAPLLLNEAIYLGRLGRHTEATVNLNEVLRLTGGQGSIGALARQLLQESPS